MRSLVQDKLTVCAIAENGHARAQGKAEVRSRCRKRDGKSNSANVEGGTDAAMRISMQMFVRKFKTARDLYVQLADMLKAYAMQRGDVEA